MAEARPLIEAAYAGRCAHRRAIDGREVHFVYVTPAAKAQIMRESRGQFGSAEMDPATGKATLFGAELVEVRPRTPHEVRLFFATRAF